MAIVVGLFMLLAGFVLKGIRADVNRKADKEEFETIKTKTLLNCERLTFKLNKTECEKKHDVCHGEVLKSLDSKADRDWMSRQDDQWQKDFKRLEESFGKLAEEIKTFAEKSSDVNGAVGILKTKVKAIEDREANR
ncbi:MAG: hypothetical protein DRI71_06765 [Bacteroidetes bacterium]|nr:MAG: hypothetical protein DRI71_06765 [Bacteroidota bacterium]